MGFSAVLPYHVLKAPLHNAASLQRWLLTTLYSGPRQRPITSTPSHDRSGRRSPDPMPLTSSDRTTQVKASPSPCNTCGLGCGVATPKAGHCPMGAAL